uniref:hypothetical protein n=1 Tax=Fodinicola feengrottensis TaxID=435914 RepID=UPI0024418740|nr:hypothetical protein [Fodinicola feengrottensis]
MADTGLHRGLIAGDVLVHLERNIAGITVEILVLSGPELGVQIGLTGHGLHDHGRVAPYVRDRWAHTSGGVGQENDVGLWWYGCGVDGFVDDRALTRAEGEIDVRRIHPAAAAAD